MNITAKFSALSVVFFAGLSASAAVVRYDSAATGTGDGSSWANAYTSLADAIAAVKDSGGEVWVKQGTHSITGGGFALANGVTVMGGFKGEDGADDAVRDVALYETILAGNDSGNADNRIVYQTVACDNNAVLDGCTLTKAQRAYDSQASNGYPLFRNCIFRNRSGICVRAGDKASADFAGCTFDHISGGNTYGIINIEKGRGSSFTDCIFTNNVGTSYAIIQNNVQTKFIRCKFFNNRASGGNVIYHSGQLSGEFYDCDMIGNVSTNSGGLTSYKIISNCVIASNIVVSTGTQAGSAYLLRGGSASLIYNSSIFDNVVETPRPNLQEGTARAVLIGGSSHGSGIVGSTIARNVCRASVGGQNATLISATFDFNGSYQGGFVNCTLVDNEVACEFVDSGRSSGSYHSLIANSIFRNRDPNYVPVKCLKPGPDFYPYDGSVYVFDSFLQNYNNTIFKRLGDDSAVRATEPMIYNAVKVGRHLVFPVRVGTPEAGPVATRAVMCANNICYVGTYDLWMNIYHSGAQVNINDIATGEPRTSLTNAYGATEIAIAKEDLLMLRAKVTPIGSGEIVGEAYQDVAPGANSAAITARTDKSGVVFGGWRKVGETAYLSTDPTFTATAMDDDLALEAVFVTPKIKYTFNLGRAGIFVENLESVITVEYDIGDRPSFPEFVPNENYWIGQWDIALPDNVGDADMTFNLQSIEKVHRIVRFNSAAADGGDGESWATAMNDISNAVAKAGLWTGEVWVKEGEHTNRTTTGWTLLNNVHVMGGFAGVDGAYATTDAERASRDPAARPTTLVGKGDYIIRQTEHCDRTAIVDGFTMTGAKYVYDQQRNETHPVFTNCTFTGKAGFRTRTSENGVINSTVDFYNCRFVALDCSNSGGQYGPIDIYEGGRRSLFTDCVFENNKITKEYGLVGANSALFTRCRFLNNTATSSAFVSNRGLHFTDCDILWNRFTTVGQLAVVQRMDGCVVASNSVVRTSASGDTTATLFSFNSEDATIYGSSIFDNEVIADSSAKTGANATARLTANTSYHQHLVNSTIARNVIRALPGEGGKATSYTICWTGAYQGGVINCTFVDNEVAVEVMDSGRTTGNSLLSYVVNSIFLNKNPDYVPVKSATLSESVPGFAIFSCVMPDFDASLVNIKAANLKNISAAPFSLGRMKVASDGRQRYYPLHRKSAADGAGVNITLGANGGVIIDGVENGNYWYHDVTNPKTLMPDILGNERPSGGFHLGSCQVCLPSGFKVIMQ